MSIDRLSEGCGKGEGRDEDKKSGRVIEGGGMEEGNVKELVLVGGKCERIRDGNVKEIGGVEEIEIQIYERDKERLRERNVKTIRKGGKCERDVREGGREGQSLERGGKNKLIEKLF